MEVDFSERIKSVFDVCDSDGTGYITVNHLKDLARDHFGADNEEETVGIINLLDPEGKGKINFQEFCRGVQEVLEVQAQSKQSTPTNSGNYSDLINSFSVGDPSPVEKQQDTSEASAYTFNEYDTTTDEDGGGLLIDFSTPETSRRNLFPAGHSSGRSSATSRTDEENFEDYGVGESDSSDANHSSCDSCQRARQRGHTARHYRHKGPNRRIASALYASHLARGSRSPIDNDIYDDIDGSFQEMNTRIKSLEQQLTKVSSEKDIQSDLKNRFKDDNSILIKRIHTLEEQLKDMEVKSDERVNDERRKYQDMISKHGLEEEKMDYLSMRLHTFESENERLKTESLRLKTENEKLKLDKLELNDRLCAVEEDYNRVSATNDEMMTKFDRERVITGELLDELQKELEELRKYKIESEKSKSTRSRNPSLSDSNGYTPLQAEMAKLRETVWLEWKNASKANKTLLEENEDLNAQLLARAIHEGQHMLAEGSSLADELDHLTKEELMTALKEQQDCSFRLKQYIDKIILSILEKNPSILEV